MDLTQDTQALQNELVQSFPGLSLWLLPKVDPQPYAQGIVELRAIHIPKALRKQGIGSQVMERLIAWADERQLILALSPSTDLGATSIGRLQKFYRQFGFVSNKGRFKDFRSRETMIRYPSN